MENRKIIGYKLIKPEYEKAAKSIIDSCCYWRDSRKYGYNLGITENISIPKLMNVGVLNLWFKPIYEPIFEENEWLYCNLKDSIALLRYNGINDSGISTKEYYQINSEQELISSGKSNLYCLPENATKATNSQIKEILSIVAKHKGFIEGVKFKSAFDYNNIDKCSNNFIYSSDDNGLHTSNGTFVYVSGIWASIIPTETELVKSWEDSFNKKGYWIDCDSEILYNENLNIENLICNSNKNIFKLESQAKSALAFAQLSHIVADANGDWEADWNDGRQDKWVIKANSNKLDVNFYCTSNQLLPMKSEEIANACLEKHITLWEDFWMINK